MENGTWAPMAAKQMRAVLETMKNVEILEPVISIKSALSDANREEIKKLADVLCQ